MLTLGLGLLLYEAATARLAHGRRRRPAGRAHPFPCSKCSGSTFTAGPRTAYSLVVLFACFLVSRRIIHSPFGLALAASARTRCACRRSRAEPRHLRKVYTIAAILAGVAGALLAQTTETVSLEVLSFGARPTCW